MKRLWRVRRLKVNKVILLGIIASSIYLLIKFASISLSDKIGQAGWQDLAFSYISQNIFAKSSLISYTARENGAKAAFFGSIIDDSLALGKFIKEDDAISTFAGNYPGQYFNYLNETKDADASESQSDIEFHDIAAKYLGLEYVLTNGAVIKSEITGRLIWDENTSYDQLNIGYLKGEISPFPEDTDTGKTAHAIAATNLGRVEYTLEQLKDFNFLIKNFYLVDGTTVADSSLFDGEKLATADMTLKQTNDKPQILIFHTHSQETYRDSRPGVEEDTVVGMGALLAKTLREKYNYNVIHDKTYYDVLKGYSKSYSQAEEGLKKMLNEYPSIEVIIDVHRDSGKEELVYINGKETAKIMMFNGLCRDHQGPMKNLENPFLQENLAFSLQLQLKSLELYPGLFDRNYLKAYRYNMHFRPKSLLVELGSENNTVESARNAIVLFAEVLDAVLKGDESEVDIADLSEQE